MSKVQVSFEEVEAMVRRFDEINSIPFTDIEWTRNGKPLVVTPGEADEWRFIGMSNTTFVETYDGELITLLSIKHSPPSAPSSPTATV